MVSRHAHFLMLRRLPLVPQVVAVALILVGIDAMNWAAHVANHRSTTLWRFHALHHSQEDMSVFTTFRTHPLSHVSYLVALLPALVLEASGTVPAAGLIAYACLVTLPHANLRWSFGPLGRVLVSPAYHRLHHSRSPVEGRRAVNFGFVLVCWDRLAGCAVYPFGREVVANRCGRPPGPCRAGRGPRQAHSRHYCATVSTVPGESRIGGSTVIRVPEQIEDAYRRLSEVKDARLTTRRGPVGGQGGAGLGLRVPRRHTRCSVRLAGRGYTRRPFSTGRSPTCIRPRFLPCWEEASSSSAGSQSAWASWAAGRRRADG